MNKKNIFAIVFCFFLFVFLGVLPGLSKAQDNSGYSKSASETFAQIESDAFHGFNFAGGTIGTVFTAILPWIFTIAGILLLLYLLYGGFHLMISGGDPKVVAEAKGKITNALVGFIIIFVAYWLVSIVGQIFGLDKVTNIFQ